MVGVRIAQGKGGARIDDAEVKMGQGLDCAGREWWMRRENGAGGIW